MSDLPRKTLPIGIQTLSEVIRQGHYYVDKTGFAQRLIARGKYYFLSRPRRFGKSLFLDTLKELFEGNQALFTGLAIHDQWDWSQRFPVLRLSFGGAVLEDKADLRQYMAQQLEKYERQFALPARYPDNRGRFTDLLASLHEQTGQRVVVLVDEYDKPILDRMEDLAKAQAMREELKNIYSVIKDQDAHIRFAFLTGVSKFAKVSLFSGLNNLKDITLDPHYSALCGYTEQDLDSVFAPELEGLNRDLMRRWYNGYNWTGTAVYNPFDLLLLFDNRQFDNWWFETGTPSFLVKLLAERGFFTPNLAQLRTSGELIGSFEIERITPEALLFQTGYLTIHKTEQTPAGNWRYTLGYPNREVEVSLNSNLLQAFCEQSGQTEQYRQNLEDLLYANDLPGMEALFHAFFAGSPDRSIPYNWHSNNKIAQYEGYYASVFYSYFAALGFEVRVEDATNHGRIDMAVILPDHIYLFEFKVVELLPDGRALQQIKTKGYADKYRAAGVPISLIGIEFSREARNVVGFEVEANATTKLPRCSEPGVTLISMS
jgi:Predicted AAA-ATPase/PD-(D/E)XK nuclease superfamily